MKKDKISLDAAEILTLLISSTDEIKSMDPEDAFNYVDKAVKALSGKLDKEFLLRARDNAKDNAEFLKQIMAEIR